MNFNVFFPSPLLGLDIQPDGLRLLELKRHGQIGIDRYVFKKLPEDVFMGDKIIEWDKLSCNISQLVLEQKIKGRKVAASLPARLVSMQHIHLPAGLSTADIEAEIGLQLQYDAPVMMDEWSIDYSVISKQLHHMDIFFVAVRKAYLVKFLACIQAGGLKVNLIDIDILALKRAIKAILPASATEITTVLKSLEKADYLVAYGLAMRDATPW